MSQRSFGPRASVIANYNKNWIDLAISDFCKVNPSRSSHRQPNKEEALSYLFARFLIGPQVYKGKDFVDVFSPTVYIKEGDKMKPYKLMVYQGYKTLMTMLFDEDTMFTAPMLKDLTNQLNKQLPGTSQMIE